MKMVVDMMVAEMVKVVVAKVRIMRVENMVMVVGGGGDGRDCGGRIGETMKVVMAMVAGVMVWKIWWL